MYEYPCKCWLVHLAAVTSFRLGMTLISAEIYGDEIKVDNSLSHPMRLNMDERQDKGYNQICSSYRLREEPLTWVDTDTEDADRQMSWNSKQPVCCKT